MRPGQARTLRGAALPTQGVFRPRDRMRECAWERTANSTEPQLPALSRLKKEPVPWKTRAGDALVQVRSKTSRGLGTSLRRGEPCLYRQIPPPVATQKNRLPMVEDGDASPIRLPPSVVAQEGWPAHRRTPRQWDPGFRGQKTRPGRNLPETTEAGGTSRRSPVARWRILPASPENRTDCIDLLRTRREATPGRRWK